MRKKFPLMIALLTAGIQLAHAAPPTQTVVILSPVYTIDKKYKSMEGPQSSQPVYLLKSESPELLWITGFHTDMVGADGQTPSLPEFMCHVNLDYDMGLHARLFNGDTGMNSRMLTLSQGQLTANFPEGFGIPIFSNEPISMNTQVLNFNLEHPDMQVRHKVTFNFIRDQDLKEPMKALINTSGFGMALLEGHDGHFGMADGDDAKHGPSCLPGAAAPNANGGSVYSDQFSRKFSGHWVIKPGREVNHTNITKYLNLPYDTTLHYAAVHLHPFAESLELRDITAKKRIFKSHARGFKDKIGLIYVDSFSSKTGVPLFKDHEYELISTYNNTTPNNQDSMAVMLLFLLDKRFQKPAAPVAAAASSMPVFSHAPHTVPDDIQPHAVLHTTAGDLLVVFFPDVAPQTVSQVQRLAKAGVYDSMPFYRLEKGFVLQTTNASGRSKPLTPDQQALIHKIPGEFSIVHHARGILSLAREDADPNSGETSFSILLADAPHLDGKYTVFGKVVGGWDVLQVLESAPRDANNHPSLPLAILKTDLLTPEQAKRVKLSGPKRLPSTLPPPSQK